MDCLLLGDKVNLDTYCIISRLQYNQPRKNQLQTLTKLKLLFKNLINLPPHKNMLISFLDKNKRAIIIVIAENKIKALEGIALLKTQKEINPTKLWVKF